MPGAPASPRRARCCQRAELVAPGRAGIPKDNISLEIEGKTIKLSTTPTAAEAAKERGDTGDDTQWHRIERSCLYAPRALQFPENADMNQVSAAGRPDAAIMRESAHVMRLARAAR